MTNSCFEDNFFLGAATVAAYTGAENIVLENNYLATQDQGDLDCPFVAYDAITETIFISCFEADAQSCQANLDRTPTFAPRPSIRLVSPTRAPVPRMTLPPALYGSSAWHRSLLYLVSLLLGLLVFMW